MFHAMIDFIFDFVVANGKHVKFAKSELDNDIWEFNGLQVTLCDNGLTKGVIWGQRLNVYQVENEDPTYSVGDENELEVIYYGMNALEMDMPV